MVRAEAACIFWLRATSHKEGFARVAAVGHNQQPQLLVYNCVSEVGSMLLCSSFAEESTQCCLVSLSLVSLHWPILIDNTGSIDHGVR